MRKLVIAVLLSVALVTGGCGAHLQYATVDLAEDTVPHMPVSVPSRRLCGSVFASEDRTPLKVVVAVCIVVIAIDAYAEFKD